MNTEHNYTLKDSVSSIIDKINGSNNSTIFLSGVKGSGKTTVLNEYLNNNLVIDGTVKDEENYVLYDKYVYKAYHTCLIINKIIDHIKNNYPNNKKLSMFEFYIYNMFEYIKTSALVGYYNKNEIINKEILQSSEKILDEFLLEASSIGLHNITLIIDNFDSLNDSSEIYQKTIYSLLKNRVKFIATISDEEVIKDDVLRNDLLKENAIIDVDYSFNPLVVKRILIKEIVKLSYFYDKVKLMYLLDYVLSNNVIEEMILKTNGNLKDMLLVVKKVFINSDKINNNDYSKCMISYIDDEINKDSFVSGNIKKSRKLYLSNLHI